MHPDEECARPRCSWQNKKTTPIRRLSPTIYAALIDSLFEAPGPLLAGIVFVAVAAAMTALKTGQALIWAFVALLIVAGAVRAFDLRRYQARKSTLTARRSRALAEALSDRGDDPGRRDRHVVLRHAVEQRRRRGPYDLSCPSRPGSWREARAGPTDGHRSFICRPLLMFGPAVIALALRGTPYYIAMSVVSAAFLLGDHAALGQFAQNIHAGGCGARARGGARRPVRHGPEQHAARALHVSRRWPAGRHEQPLPRNAGPAGRHRQS